MADWLNDFVDLHSYGETPDKVMWWVGVVTIAGVLQRKVWIEQFSFQWTPNFYLLIVGPPGEVKKSTSIGLGTRLLRRVDGVDLGPDNVTWQQLVTHMAQDSYRTWLINGEQFEACCCTMALSEFGTFFDPNDRMLVDALTDLWDSKLGQFKKETKTNGSDNIINPWINIYACCTPEWINDNFNTKLIGSGFACRPVYVYCPKKKRNVALPDEHMPPREVMRAKEDALLVKLREMAEYTGDYTLTKEARIWINKWYADYGEYKEKLTLAIEKNLYERGQTHLMKLAMVISAARGKFPIIDVEVMEESARRLTELKGDVEAIFGFVGQSPTSKSAQAIVDALKRTGPMRVTELYRRVFFRSIGFKDFEAAMQSAIEAGLVKKVGDVSNPGVELA